MQTFVSEIQRFDHEKFAFALHQAREEDVKNVLTKRVIELEDMAVLLSKAGDGCLEDMAQRAHQKRTQHFGKAVVLYTPLYLANHCINGCTYCGYNVHNKIDRHILSTDEIEREAQAIAETGLKHILILTGESSHHTPVSYIVDAVKVLRKYFESISIEIYPLNEEEYKEVIEAGVDGLTVYQEVYNPEIYDAVHVSGPKKDYNFRLEAPERAAVAGIRSVNIGALLGLDDWRQEAFKTAWHAMYLQKKYPELELSVSMPRIRPCVGGYEVEHPVDDRAFVQIMLAFGCFLPSVGITISTREEEAFRNNLVPLGATKLSAGVSTAVGGHSKDDEASDAQFEISDTRTVEEMKAFLRSIGYQPVFKDWFDMKDLRMGEYT